jgi:hypothetical protein
MPTHPLCAAQCQKLAKLGEFCPGCCELAPFDPNSPEIPQGWLAAPLDGDYALVSADDKSGITWGHLFGRNLNPIVRLPGWVDPAPRAAKPMDEYRGGLAASPGTLCPACGCPQFMTAKGIDCKNGHGAVEGVSPSIPPAPVAVNPPPATTPRARINVRAKGQRGEREVVKIIQDIVSRCRARYGLDDQVIQRNALQAHLGGCDLHGLEGFAIEVKWQENENLPGWWRQAVSQAEALSKPNRVPHIPILFYRRNGRPWGVKWRAYVQTPRDRDLIELDIEADLADFVEWFENAYDEYLIEISQTLK